MGGEHKLDLGTNPTPHRPHPSNGHSNRCARLKDSSVVRKPPPHELPAFGSGLDAGLNQAIDIHRMADIVRIAHDAVPYQTAQQLVDRDIQRLALNIP